MSLAWLTFWTHCRRSGRPRGVPKARKRHRPYRPRDPYQLRLDQLEDRCQVGQMIPLLAAIFADAHPLGIDKDLSRLAVTLPAEKQEPSTPQGQSLSPDRIDELWLTDVAKASGMASERAESPLNARDPFGGPVVTPAETEDPFAEDWREPAGSDMPNKPRESSRPVGFDQPPPVPGGGASSRWSAPPPFVALRVDSDRLAAAALVGFASMPIFVGTTLRPVGSNPATDHGYDDEHQPEHDPGNLITPPDLPPSTGASLAEAYAKLPVAFEANVGQTDAQVRFLNRGHDYALFLTSSEAVLSFRLHEHQLSEHDHTEHDHSGDENEAVEPATSAVVRMQFVGANPDVQVSAADELPGKINYFFGDDPQQWHTDISTYGRVEYENLYAGIDLVFRGSNQYLEYDLVVAPGADPGLARLHYDGVDALRLDDQGNLVLQIHGHELPQLAPVIYQEADGTRQTLAGRYVLYEDHQVGFQVDAYDSTRPLIIDPIIGYSTYLDGMQADEGLAIAVDSQGSAYVTGYTASTDFPTASPYQATNGGGQDVFITKLNSTGSALVYSTYLGGAGDDVGYGIFLDGSNNAYVAGKTASSNFPLQAAYQGTFGGVTDAFVTKLNASGNALTFSTYLGGSAEDEARGIVVNSSGNAFLTGLTASTTFPTLNPIQSANGGGVSDAFVTQFNTAGSGLVYSTYLGGSATDEGHGIALDSTGRAYVTGSTGSTNFPTVGAIQGSLGGGIDAFVTRVNAAGSAWDYSTYLGGTSDDWANGVSVDASNNAYLTGRTAGTFPTVNPIQANNAGAVDAFVTKVNPSGSALTYSTYLGGAGDDEGLAIAVAADNSAYVAGWTASSGFPLLKPIQDKFAGVTDGFITRIDAAGAAHLFSTFLGGSKSDAVYGFVLDNAGRGYVTGGTASADFPTYEALFPVFVNPCLEGPGEIPIPDICPPGGFVTEILPWDAYVPEDCG